MQSKQLFTLLAVLVALPACTPGPIAGQQAPAMGTAVPTIAGVVAADNQILTGVVMGPEAPLVNAPVTAYFLGENSAIATGRTAADGSFTLAFPASATNRLINVVATQGNVTLVATTSLDSEETNPFRVLATRAPLPVTPGSTLLSLALGDRLQALAGTRPSARAVREATASLRAAAASAVEAVKALSPSQLQAFLSIAGPLGLGTIPPAIANAVTAAGTAFRAEFIKAAAQVTAAITAQVQAGATLPTGFNPGPTDFGTVTTPPVSGAPAPGTTTPGGTTGTAPEGSNGSSGGSNGSGSSGVTANVAVGTPSAGGYSEPTTPTTGTSGTAVVPAFTGLNP